MKKKYFILILIIMIAITLSLIIYNRKQTIKKWKNIENDFNTVNEFIIDYYNHETDPEKNVYLYFYGEMELDNKSEKIKINNDIEQRLEKITDYINTQSPDDKYWDAIIIYVQPTWVQYALFNGSAHIVYYREKKPSLFERQLLNLEHLSGNWYKIHSKLY